MNSFDFFHFHIFQLTTATMTSSLSSSTKQRMNNNNVDIPTTSTFDILVDFSRIRRAQSSLCCAMSCTLNSSAHSDAHTHTYLANEFIKFLHSLMFYVVYLSGPCAHSPLKIRHEGRTTEAVFNHRATRAHPENVQLRSYEYELTKMIACEFIST